MGDNVSNSSATIDGNHCVDIQKTTPFHIEGEQTESMIKEEIRNKNIPKLFNSELRANSVLVSVDMEQKKGWICREFDDEKIEFMLLILCMFCLCCLDLMIKQFMLCLQLYYDLNL